jgi:hypothetical protein
MIEREIVRDNPATVVDADRHRTRDVEIRHRSLAVEESAHGGPDVAVETDLRRTDHLSARIDGERFRVAAEIGDAPIGNQQIFPLIPERFLSELPEPPLSTIYLYVSR